MNAGLWKQWKATKANLNRAFALLTEPQKNESREIKALTKAYLEYIENNELELAMDMLEEIGGISPCRGGYWKSLETAAEIMKLEERIPYFRKMYDEALWRLKDGSR
jgi:hypothetical protein